MPVGRFACDNDGALFEARGVAGLELRALDEPLDAAGPLESGEPAASAHATAGTETIAAPTPSEIIDAPTQVNTLSWLGVVDFGNDRPPNLAGSIRSPLMPAPQRLW
ncbi:hypothetical protein ACXDF8_11440 [Mycolicibacterium sp. CBM1]